VWLFDAAYLTPEGRLARADLAVDRGVVADITRPSAGRPGSVDCSSYVVIPGLVNAHFHSQSTALRGLNVGLQLYEWGGDSPRGQIQNRLFRWLDEQASPEETAVLCRKEYLDLLRQGVTFVADSGFAQGLEPTVLLGVLREVGLRGSVDAYEAIDRLGDQTGLSAHLPEEEDLTAETVAAAVRRRTQLDPVFTTHCLETDWRRERVLADWGVSTVRLFADQGLLGPKTVLFHGCRMDEDDAALVVEAGLRSCIARCPTSPPPA